MRDQLDATAIPHIFSIAHECALAFAAVHKEIVNHIRNKSPQDAVIQSVANAVDYEHEDVQREWLR